MITHEEVILLVEKNPNDSQLGSKIRQLYWYDREKPYRHEDNLPDITPQMSLHGMGDITEEPAIIAAQQTITEGTSDTSLDSQMEEAHSILENEKRFPGNKSTDYTVHGYDANGSPVEEKLDTTLAYTKNPHPRSFT